MNISDILGCSALHGHEQYCILNTTYSQQEYEQLCGKIIEHMRETGEWGEFFPSKYSPFGYNETVAQDLWPLSRQEALDRDWRWRDQKNTTSTQDSYVPLDTSQYAESHV